MIYQVFIMFMCYVNTGIKILNYSFYLDLRYFNSKHPEFLSHKRLINTCSTLVILLTFYHAFSYVKANLNSHTPELTCILVKVLHGNIRTKLLLIFNNKIVNSRHSLIFRVILVFVLLLLLFSCFVDRYFPIVTK